MPRQDDGLFLLEVLIDKIVFVKSPCFSDKDFRTCVNIECPAVEPMEICDDDTGACVAKSGGPFVKTFNNGKSCLFSLKESDISAAMSRFPIKISVFKSLPCGCLPTKIVMGEATIDMTKEFVKARKKFLEDPTTVSYQALKDSFRITGPDGSETGEVLMFLRISCFGKLIITRFQGAGGPPNLGAGSGADPIVDRSCNPQRDFQTTQEPCVCGAARGHGVPGKSSEGHGGATCSRCGAPVCPPARDPYNTMPCEDPDDPCYCTGPKTPVKDKMVCRNTDQYCLHVPKGTLLNLPFTQEISEEQKTNIRAWFKNMHQFQQDKFNTSVMNDFNHMKLPNKKSNDNCLEMSLDCIKLPLILSEKSSSTSFSTTTSKRRIVAFSDNIDYISKSRQTLPSILEDEGWRDIIVDNHLFGQIETTVYMTLYDEFCRYQNSASQLTTGTQATASINKCLQVNCNKDSTDSVDTTENLPIDPYYYSSYANSVQSYCSNRKLEKVRYSDVYFFGRKQDDKKCKTGMGSSGSRTTLTKDDQAKTKQVHNVSKQAQTQKPVEIKETKPNKMDTDQTLPNKSKLANPGLSAKPVEKMESKPNKVDKDQTPISSSNRSKPSNPGFSVKPVETMESKPNKMVKEQTPITSPNRSKPSNSVCSVNGQCKGTCKKYAKSSAGTCTKTVSIKESPMEKPCPAICSVVKGEMVATISHIRLGPREPCPVHGKEPCQGPKCIVASSGEEQAPVKITTMTNPRRGVFELVIRRITGAPLAKNELMLEWTPPPSRPPSCGQPCSVSCVPVPVPCRPSKCKMIICRPSPYKPKGCRKPCEPVPCRSVPCKTCPPPCCNPCKPACCRPCRSCPPPRKIFKRPCPPPSCCRPCKPRPPSPCSLCTACPTAPPPCRPPPCRPPKPCRRCKPCPPIPCKPCRLCKPKPLRPCSPCMACPPPSCPPLPCSLPCALPCCSSPCSFPCKSSPCLRPCPIGRRKTRKCRSQPKIKPHRKRISPCCNRLKTCPVVRCRSVPGPCPTCSAPLPCSPRKCCSVLPCKPKCCKSCLSCCD